jgi:hypothetical protein
MGGSVVVRDAGGDGASIIGQLAIATELSAGADGTVGYYVHIGPASVGQAEALRVDWSFTTLVPQRTTACTLTLVTHVVQEHTARSG